MSGAVAGDDVDLGRYELGREIASGGMATVYLGRALGSAGFSRTVAIKRLLPRYARDPDLVSMFLDEGRLASKIHHPNVVAILDVVVARHEAFLVMEYVRGLSLAELLRSSGDAPCPVPIVLAIATGVLYGLHAAHEAKTEAGVPLGIVHRDVSPQNVLVGADGVARVVDFGIAKASVRAYETRRGEIKGKLRYMAPEQLSREPIDRRADIFSTAMVLREVLGVGVRSSSEVWLGVHPPEVASSPSSLPPPLDEIVKRASARDPADRYPTALDMARALEAAGPIATPAEVSEWTRAVAGKTLSEREQRVAEVEGETHSASAARALVKKLVARAETQSSGVHATADDNTERLESSDPNGSPVLFDMSGTDGSATVPVRDVAAEEATQLSPGVPSRAPWAHRRRVTYGVMLSGVVVVGVLVALVAPRRPSKIPNAAGSSPTSMVGATNGTTERPAELPSPSSAELAPTAIASIPPSSAIRPASPTDAGSPIRGPAKHVRKGCDPPYIIDADGHKRFKGFCL